MTSRLEGHVHAGAHGEKPAKVMALELKGAQLKIGEVGTMASAKVVHIEPLVKMPSKGTSLALDKQQHIGLCCKLITVESSLLQPISCKPSSKPSKGNSCPVFTNARPTNSFC
jgi:hypothetical protein